MLFVAGICCYFFLNFKLQVLFVCKIFVNLMLISPNSTLFLSKSPCFSFAVVVVAAVDVTVVLLYYNLKVDAKSNILLATYSFPKADDLQRRRGKGFNPKTTSSLKFFVVNIFGETCKAGLNKPFCLFQSGRFWAVWPDLAKFRHFGKMCKVLVPFWEVNLLFGKILVKFLSYWAYFRWCDCPNVEI